MMTVRTATAVCALAVLFLVAGCFCRPQDAAKSAGNPTPAMTAAAASSSSSSSSSTSNRTSRLQKPTQVLNVGFDEIVVESNLQVHNRVGSKNKSKIMLSPNSTTAALSPTNKSARSLVV